MKLVKRCSKACRNILNYCPTFKVYDCIDCGAGYTEQEVKNVNCVEIR